MSTFTIEGSETLRFKHELQKVQQEALCNATLQGISSCERVTYVVRAVKEKAHKVATQITTDCLATNKSQVPLARFGESDSAQKKKVLRT